MRQKVALYILSMTMFFIMVGLLCMNIPICFDEDAEFIGFESLWNNIRFGLLIIVLTLIVEYLTYRFLKNMWENTAEELSVKVVEVSEENYDTLTFIASFVIPLVSFQFHQLSHWVALMLLIVAIGYIFCHSKGYYTNPTLVLMKFHLYKLTVETQQVEGDNRKHLVMISRKDIEKGTKFRYVKISKEVGYVM